MCVAGGVQGTRLAGEHPTHLLLPTLKWSGHEAFSSDFPRPPEASRSTSALPGLLFREQLGPSIPEHGRNRAWLGWIHASLSPGKGKDDR